MPGSSRRSPNKNPAEVRDRGTTYLAPLLGVKNMAHKVGGNARGLGAHGAFKGPHDAREYSDPSFRPRAISG